jgi:hypothetical protein
MAGLILVRLFMLFGGRKRIIWKSN